MQARHNVLLVTNDHVRALTAMSDNVLTVSATDRESVDVNGRAVARALAVSVCASRVLSIVLASTDTPPPVPSLVLVRA